MKVISGRVRGGKSWEASGGRSSGSANMIVIGWMGSKDGIGGHFIGKTD